jgi:DNA-binding HxlR family transcriptional regulator
MVRGCVRGASDHESAATKVLRDTKFWREKGSTKVASQRGEQRALDEPSLEKAPGRYCPRSGTSRRFVVSRSPRHVGVSTPGDRLLDWTILWAYSARLRSGPGEGTRRGRRRYQDLHDALDGISYEVLTDTLQRAERDGLVMRHVDAGRVETATLYRLTDLGHSLDETLAALDRRTASYYWHQVEEAARQY